MPKELPVLTVANATTWSQWLFREAETSVGVWLTLAKKGVTTPTSLTYALALDEALCHGWIDGQARRNDASTYYHRFTPRTKTSSWSQRNVAHIARLEAEGRMTARGLLEVEKAKADGRWERAYAGQAGMVVDGELRAAIEGDEEARAGWEELGRGERYVLCQRLGALKTEVGRRRRIGGIVEGLKQGRAEDGVVGGGVGVGPSGSASVKPTKAVSSATPTRVVKATRSLRDGSSEGKDKIR
ncbi:uncharacterized protein LTR77_003156 [Saxophila tyrrhenica]|uniref:OmdA domain containing protein n=1 Tax=Saxophila tyrrhenica TaxID=1690608 RepID=A0AAV9PH15_9PEZI|nr:hypothetical protein LTR77_003156 [Saxophila tyrrhenica]